MERAGSSRRTRSISKQDLEQLEAQSSTIQQAVIVGGGLIGIELAEMLHSRGIKVTFLVREQHFWNNIIADSESRMVEQHMQEHGIDLRLATSLNEICGDENGNVEAIITEEGQALLANLLA